MTTTSLTTKSVGRADAPTSLVPGQEEQRPGDGNGDGVVQASVANLSRRGMLLSFLKIGATGFGGGMAIIALMEDEFVRKHRAMSSDEFVSGVGLSQFLGAFPVNTAVFIGYRLYGMTGSLLSALAFLSPSVSLVILLSMLYFHLHTLPALDNIFRAVNPVVIALIVSAAWSLGRRIIHSVRAVFISGAALIASVLHVHPVLVLIVAAILGLLLTEHAAVDSPQDHRQVRWHRVASVVPLFGKLAGLGATFLKVGFFFFGGGFALIPLLQSVIVRQQHWLTPKEFLDGIAISSLTPGPIAVIATFVGYRAAGVFGAITGTVALFLPGTILMVWISRGYGHFKHSKPLLQILSGVNPATIGLVLGAGVTLGRGSMTSLAAVVFFLFCLILLTRLKWPPPIVLALGAAVGFLHGI